MLNTMKEADRRDYFRIEDQLLLDFRVVRASAVDTEPAENHFPPSSTFNLMRDLRALEQDHNAARASADHDRELDQHLRLLNRKIDLVAAAIVAIELDRSALEPQQVSLSEGGVAFQAEQAIPLDTILALQLQLLPELAGLHLYGQVIHNQHARNDDQPQVAVKFLNLRETDRQLLARHILKSQINARRQQQQRD